MSERYTDMFGLAPVPQPEEPKLEPAKNWAVLAEIAGVLCLFEIPENERIGAVEQLLERELVTEEMREEFTTLAAEYSDKVVRAMNANPDLLMGEVIKRKLEVNA